MERAVGRLNLQVRGQKFGLVLSLVLGFSIGAHAPAFGSPGVRPELNEAIREYASGNYSRAKSLCRKVLAAEPGNLRAHYVIAATFVAGENLRVDGGAHAQW